MIALAGILAEYKTEMICDLAETYQIYDYKRVPARMLGTLVSGLREESRIGRKLSGRKASTEAVLLANIIDLLSVVFADKGKKPEPIAKLFIEEVNTASKGFDTPEEFEKARERIIRKVVG